jgi:hypothetical protein
MPNETGAITMAFVLQIWFFAVLLVVAALAWRQAHTRRASARRSRR